MSAERGASVINPIYEIQDEGTNNSVYISSSTQGAFVFTPNTYNNAQPELMGESSVDGAPDASAPDEDIQYEVLPGESAHVDDPEGAVVLRRNRALDSSAASIISSSSVPLPGQERRSSIASGNWDTDVYKVSNPSSRRGSRIFAFLTGADESSSQDTYAQSATACDAGEKSGTTTPGHHLAWSPSEYNTLQHAPRGTSMYGQGSMASVSSMSPMAGPVQSESTSSRAKLLCIAGTILLILAAIAIAALAVHNAGQTDSTASSALSSASSASASSAKLSEQLQAFNRTMEGRLDETYARFVLASDHNLTVALLLQQIVATQTLLNQTAAQLADLRNTTASSTAALQEQVHILQANLSDVRSTAAATTRSLQQQVLLLQANLTATTNALNNTTTLLNATRADLAQQMQASQAGASASNATIALLRQQLAALNATFLSTSAELQSQQVLAAMSWNASLARFQTTYNQSLSSLVSTQVTQSSLLNNTASVMRSLIAQTKADIMTNVTTSFQALAASTPSTPSVPVLGVIIWNGATSSIPAGFWLCDGSTAPNGQRTPDLRSRFVVGASVTSTPGNGLTGYLRGAAGGEEAHVLADNEMPSHQHGSNIIVAVGSSNVGSSWQSANIPISSPIQSLVAKWEGTAGGTGFVTGTSWYGGDSSIQSRSKGATTAHNNMPPYYALAYIMRYV